MEQHYHHFEDVEENKFIYTDIFREYVSAQVWGVCTGMGVCICVHVERIMIPQHPQTELIERHLELELKARMPNFVMERFMKTLE